MAICQWISAFVVVIHTLSVLELFNSLKNSIIDRKHTFLSLLSKLHISLYPYFSAVISALIPSPFFCSMLQPAKQRHLKHSYRYLKSFVKKTTV